MAEDWVRNHLISIEIDKDVIDNFISKGYKGKRRFLKLNEERLAKYFPDLLPAVCFFFTRVPRNRVFKLHT